jgi:hypothetical protein
MLNGLFAYAKIAYFESAGPAALQGDFAHGEYGSRAERASVRHRPPCLRLEGDLGYCPEGKA